MGSGEQKALRKSRKASATTGGFEGGKREVSMDIRLYRHVSSPHPGYEHSWRRGPWLACSWLLSWRHSHGNYISQKPLLTGWLGKLPRRASLYYVSNVFRSNTHSNSGIHRLNWTRPKSEHLSDCLIKAREVGSLRWVPSEP